MSENLETTTPVAETPVENKETKAKQIEAELFKKLEEQKAAKRALTPAQALVKNLLMLSGQLKELSPFSRQVKAAFKNGSKNELIRVAIFLLDLTGKLEQEKNKYKTDYNDLQELLRLNNIDSEMLAAKTEAKAEETADASS